MADEVQEVLRTTYQWKTFDLEEARAGAVIGFPKTENGSPDLTDSENIGEKTGKLQTEAVIRYTPYSTFINGKRLWPNERGEIVYCDDPAMIGKQLYICTVNLVSTKGTHQATTRSVGEAYNEVSVLNSLEVRDTFAVYALQGLLKHCEQPQYFDDANIMVVCSAAYRWAQGMMQTSADARALVAKNEGGSGGEGGEGEDSGTTRGAVDVTEGTNTEKLLSNLVAAVDDLTAVQKKMLKTTGEGESATTTLNIPSLKVEQPIKVDNAQEEGEDKEFKVSGGGGGSSLNRDDVNDAGSTITDVVVYNTAVGKAPLRATIANFASKVLSTLGLNWLIKKGETSIADASSFFTQYKEEMATALADKFDAKGAASTAEANAKQYADDNFVRKQQ